MAPTLTVLTGPPGSGKSTLAEELALASARSVLVPGDRFLGFLRAGAVLPWRDGAEAQNEVAWRASLRAARAYLEGGYDVVYDGIVYPDAIGRLAAEIGTAPIDYVVLLPPVEVCVRRVRDRPGHGFRELDVTRDMHERFATAALGDRHVVAGVNGAVRAAVVEGLEAARFRIEVAPTP